MRLACISGKLKGLTQSRCKRENQNASNSAAFNEIATSQQLLLSRLPLGFAAFDQRPCFLPDTRSWRFMPAPKVRKNRLTYSSGRAAIGKAHKLEARQRLRISGVSSR